MTAAHIPNAIARTDAETVAAEFNIGDVEALWAALDISHWAYWNNRIDFRELPTTKALVAKFEKAKKAIEGVLEELQTADAFVRDRLSGSQLSPSARTRANLVQHAILSQPVFVRQQVNLPALLEELDAIRNEAEKCAEHYRDQIDEGHSKNPVREMDRRVLLTNIREFWSDRLGRDFTRLFDDYNEETGRNTTIPKNQCSKFVVRWAQLIDPELGVGAVCEAMKQDIKYFKQNEK